MFPSVGFKSNDENTNPFHYFHSNNTKVRSPFTTHFFTPPQTVSVLSNGVFWNNFLRLWWRRNAAAAVCLPLNDVLVCFSTKHIIVGKVGWNSSSKSCKRLQRSLAMKMENIAAFQWRTWHPMKRKSIINEFWKSCTIELATRFDEVVRESVTKRIERQIEIEKV